MDLIKFKTTIIIVFLTLLSGFGDSQGFLHASKIWKKDNIVFDELVKSALGFGVGIVTYWFMIKYLRKLGIVSPEIQTIAWFGITIIGVALVSGHFLKWSLIDQVIGVITVVGIGWLLFRVGG